MEFHEWLIAAVTIAVAVALAALALLIYIVYSFKQIRRLRHDLETEINALEALKSETRQLIANTGELTNASTRLNQAAQGLNDRHGKLLEKNEQIYNSVHSQITSIQSLIATGENLQNTLGTSIETYQKQIEIGEKLNKKINDLIGTGSSLLEQIDKAKDALKEGSKELHRISEEAKTEIRRYQERARRVLLASFLGTVISGITLPIFLSVGSNDQNITNILISMTAGFGVVTATQFTQVSYREFLESLRNLPSTGYTKIKVALSRFRTIRQRKP